MVDVAKLIEGIEKVSLVIIAGFTVYAMGQEMSAIVAAHEVRLTDLLLMFIFAEVLGMVASFYKSQVIPINIPIFIAITAVCRMLILRGKEGNSLDLMLESGAVLVLAVASIAVRARFPEVRRSSGTRSEIPD